MERMTFGDDASVASDHAWDWVTNQTWPGWRVDVLHSSVAGEVEPAVRSVRQAPSTCGFASVRNLVSHLEPRIALSEHAGTDLIVVGDHPDGTPTVLSRTAEWLLTNSAVPVVVAKSTAPVRSVLACVDPPRSFIAAVQTFLQMPWAERTVVIVLAVRGFDGGYRREADEGLQLLNDAGIRTQLRVVEPNPTVATSSPKHRAFDTIDRVRPDLVVIGADRSSRILRTIEGSTSIEVARYAPCSVLVARQQ